jgi:hypothetical protein
MCFPWIESVMAEDIRDVVGTCIPYLLDIVVNPSADGKESGKAEERAEKGKGSETPQRSKGENHLVRLSWELLLHLQDSPVNRQVILSKLSLLMASSNVAAQQFAEDLLLTACQKKDTKTRNANIFRSCSIFTQFSSVATVLQQTSISMCIRLISSPESHRLFLASIGDLTEVLSSMLDYFMAILSAFFSHFTVFALETWDV